MIAQKKAMHVHVTFIEQKWSTTKAADQIATDQYNPDRDR